MPSAVVEQWRLLVQQLQQLTGDQQHQQQQQQEQLAKVYGTFMRLLQPDAISISDWKAIVLNMKVCVGWCSGWGVVSVSDS